MADRGNRRGYVREMRTPPSSRLTRLTALAVASVLVFAACGGDSDDTDAGAGADTGIADDTDSVGSEPEASGRAEWTDADFERLVALPIDGYTLESGEVSEFGNATSRYLENVPSTTVTLGALVTFDTCDPFLCTDLAAELDEQARENLRSLLPTVHIENPDLVEEVGPTELAGRTVLGIYFRSYVGRDDGQSTALSYRAITHDGTNLITVQVGPDFMAAGGLADSAEELAERMSPAEGAAVAEDILTALSAELG